MNLELPAAPPRRISPENIIFAELVEEAVKIYLAFCITR